MAFLRTWRKGRARYFAVVRNRRRGRRVVQTVCEYLGRDPDPAWRALALRYWREKERGGRA
jgi:hypothetical protein